MALFSNIPSLLCKVGHIFLYPCWYSSVMQLVTEKLLGTKFILRLVIYSTMELENEILGGEIVALLL